VLASSKSRGNTGKYSASGYLHEAEAQLKNK
jgi:hypothetical protein